VPTITTVVTCMTDAERPFLAEALRSVQAQTIPTRVTLCVSDLNDWVDEVVSRMQPGIDVLPLPLASLASVRNQALATVQTDLVAFLDGDDAWRPDKLQRQVNALVSGELDVVACKHILVREEGTPYFYGFAMSVPMPSSWLGRTTAFRDRPFEDVRVGEDVLLWRRLTAEVRWQVLNDFLLRYRVRESSLSQMTPSKKRKLAYARRSRLPGMRPVLLSASYTANVGLRIRSNIAKAATQASSRPVDR
jgi:glycosyltransferase involved in cell wall biosynthesis